VTGAQKEFNLTNKEVAEKLGFAPGYLSILRSAPDNLPDKTLALLEEWKESELTLDGFVERMNGDEPKSESEALIEKLSQAGIETEKMTPVPPPAPEPKEEPAPKRKGRKPKPEAKAKRPYKRREPKTPLVNTAETAHEAVNDPPEKDRYYPHSAITAEATTTTQTLSPAPA